MDIDNDNEQNTSTEEESTLKDQLGAIWDKKEADDGTSGIDESAEPAASAPQESGDRELGATDQHPADPLGVPGENANTGLPETLGQADQGASLAEPPRSLSPAAREAWNQTPEPVKQDIAKREADYANGIQKYAENAKRAQQMDATLAPYSQLFAMNGGPQNTLPGLLQTAALLQMGSSAQQAQTIANLVRQFGVSVKDLDNALVGQGPTPETQQNSQFEQMLEQRLAPIQQTLGQFQQHQQQQFNAEQQEISSEVDRFAADPENEFYNDVKLDMADLMDMAANRGRNMSMKDAYDRACQMHPHISQILLSLASSAASANKLQAASVLSGDPSGERATAAPTGMNAQLNAAWDSVADNDAGRM